MGRQYKVMGLARKNDVTPSQMLAYIQKQFPDMQIRERENGEDHFVHVKDWTVKTTIPGYRVTEIQKDIDTSRDWENEYTKVPSDHFILGENFNMSVRHACMRSVSEIYDNSDGANVFMPSGLFVTTKLDLYKVSKMVWEISNKRRDFRSNFIQPGELKGTMDYLWAQVADSTEVNLPVGDKFSKYKHPVQYFETLYITLDLRLLFSKEFIRFIHCVKFDENDVGFNIADDEKSFTVRLYKVSVPQDLNIQDYRAVYEVLLVGSGIDSESIVRLQGKKPEDHYNQIIVETFNNYLGLSDLDYAALNHAASIANTSPEKLLHATLMFIRDTWHKSSEAERELFGNPDADPEEVADKLAKAAIDLYEGVYKVLE
ncbi:hypothetical protein JOC36_001440 [Weissella uvarum]|uniref:hypothetical protein n=1 Tax=Weissella uvarum TaxID=1479233 RepID=UPI0019608236|nr:hypothetical protein [Weissella uvarum]MBM7617847.1 hypothetical protein [Weissella uvarum]MCM0596155.1 hypothetical protein [Weissella uvarum]